MNGIKDWRAKNMIFDINEKKEVIALLGAGSMGRTTSSGRRLCADRSEA